MIRKFCSWLQIPEILSGINSEHSKAQEKKSNYKKILLKNHKGDFETGKFIEFISNTFVHGQKRKLKSEKQMDVL